MVLNTGATKVAVIVMGNFGNAGIGLNYRHQTFINSDGQYI